MKKQSLRFVSLLLSAALAFACVFSVPAAARTPSSAQVPDTSAASMFAPGGLLYKPLYRAADKLLNTLLTAINFIYPSPAYPDKAGYVSENFYEGSGAFRDEPQAGARWRLGFASASILTGDELDGKHFVGGSITAKGRKTATEIWDDMKIRVTALSDGSGGTVVVASLDAYGLANNDVREIRARLASYAERRGIVSINVCSLHQHSVIDTFGMNGDLADALVFNPLKHLAGFRNTENGKNPAFMENLFNVAVDTVERACENMEPGRLYFGSADAAEYVFDKRPPYVNDGRLNRLRFDPDNPQSRETMMLFWYAHCLGNGASNTQVTSDYPYYMEQIVNERADANFMMLYGAGQSNTMNTDPQLLGLSGSYTALEKIRAYAAALAERMLGISPAGEAQIEPLSNIRHSEVFLPVDNEVIRFGRSAAFFQNTALRSGSGLEMVTEIGYWELGARLAVVFVPGEIEPALVYGGALSEAESWSGQPWNYPSLQEMAGPGRKLLVAGVANDQIGYIVPDNDYMPMTAPQSKGVEFVSLGKTTGSRLVAAFNKLITEVR